MDYLERMLELNEKVESGQTATKKTNYMPRAASKEDLDKIVEQYDYMAYGPQIQQTDGSQPYDARTAMEQIKESYKHGGPVPKNINNSRMPNKILQEMINNPIPIEPMVVDRNMDALEERITGKMPGIKASKKLLEDLDKRDVNERKERKNYIGETNDTKQYTNQAAYVDYGVIRDIVENAIERKIGELKTVLNESTGSGRTEYLSPSCKTISFKDNFYFVDNDDNVFECQMVYKGKNKKRKK